MSRIKKEFGKSVGLFFLIAAMLIGMADVPIMFAVEQEPLLLHMENDK